MGSKDSRVDAYIAHAAPFARPILAQLRASIHAACPTVVETIKWGHPFFEHRGVLCSIAACNTHCELDFGRSPTPHETVAPVDTPVAFRRIARLAELPKRGDVEAQVKKAATRNASVAATRRERRTVTPPAEAIDPN
jgi:hypothetical protein